MHLGGYCPGCGGGDGNQSCAIARCSREHGNVEFCCHCSEYPCRKFEGLDEYDSFISTRSIRETLRKIQIQGLETYKAEMADKIVILSWLLANCNAGRQKSSFSTAVNLLPLEDLRAIQARLESSFMDLPVKERAKATAALLQEAASIRGIDLKLRKKAK